MNNKCPVCTQDIKNIMPQFCPTCNWELISIPSTASNGLKNYYNEKLELHKAAYKTNDKLNDEIQCTKQRLDTLEKKNSELESKNKSLNSDVANQKPLLDKVKKMEQEISQSEKIIKDLREKVNREMEAKEREQRAHEATKTKNRISKL